MSADVQTGSPRRYTRQELREALGRVPRANLAFLPTPLQDCPRLSGALGGPRILVKRDDQTGLAFGGNKTRQLEFLLAAAQQAGADTIVTGAYTNSNFCRQTAAGARALGMDVHLLLMRGMVGDEPQGNLLIDLLLGADVTIVDVTESPQLGPLLEERAEKLRQEGRRPYILNIFGDSGPLASFGYVEAFIELEEQLEAMGVTGDVTLYLSAANVTQAGLALAKKALGSRVRVVGFTPIRWEEDRPTDIARIATRAAELLGLDVALSPEEIENDDTFVGERYGVLTPECVEAMSLVAGTEAIILDPVYTGKAMAGLIDRIRRGAHAAEETVVFLHSGGTPAVFSYAGQLAGALGRRPRQG